MLSLFFSVAMKPYKLQEIIDNVLRLTKGRREEVAANWNQIHMPVAFTSRRGAIDVVLTPTEVKHDEEEAAISIIISSKPSADFKGAIELVIFQDQMPYLAGWIAEFMALSEYRRVHDLIVKKLYETHRIVLLSSVIEIKKKKGESR